MTQSPPVMTDLPAAGAPMPLRPGRGSEDEGSPLPVTACRRCRKQKLRCSRDLPVCKRCKDISAACEYPPPPDRKLLAAQRLQNAKARARRESENFGGLHDQRRLSDTTDDPHATKTPPSVAANSYVVPPHLPTGEGHDDSRRSFPGLYPPSVSPPLLANLKRTTLPSSEVAMLLFEIYFSRLYNATLLFHKQKLISEYAANRVPDFVSLSVFALASIFLRQPTTKHAATGDDVELGISMLSASDWSRQGLEWATAASQRVLMQADQPSIETIQACQNIALYWWTVGEKEKTHIHSNLAYANARLLGLHVQSDTTNDSERLSDEIRRRCFWACWINQCVGQENATFKAEPWKDAIGLKLPSDEEAYNAGHPNANEVFDEDGNIVSFDGSETSPTTSDLGELVKLINIWWEIQRFVKKGDDGTSTSASAKIAELLDFDRRLGIVFDNFHPLFRYANAASFTSPQVDKYRLFALHCLYRISACILHSSIVPVFSNSDINPYVSKKVVRLSAEESVKHATVLLDMATAFVGTRADASRLSVVTGFAMFVACTVQLRSLGAQGKLQTNGTSRFRAATLILEQSKSYSRGQEGLWMKLKSIFAAAGLNIETICATDSRYQSNADDQPTDLDQLVSHEGTPQSTGAADLYTYVTTQEPAPIPLRRSSEPQFQSRLSKSAQTTPSPKTNPSIAEGHVGHEATLSMHQRQDGPVNLAARQTTPHIHQSSPQPPQLPVRYENFDQQGYITNNNVSRRTVGAVVPNSFLPLGTVPEDYQMQGAPTSMAYRTPGTGSVASDVHGMDGYGNYAMMSTAMDIDGVNFWWDQSYGIDCDPFAPSMPADGGAFNHGVEQFLFG